ncbi:MAG TPA: hypothetical protein VGD02_12215 [Gemmatimonadaceae bacterium]|jgi:hypothetical protein
MSTDIAQGGYLVAAAHEANCVAGRSYTLKYGSFRQLADRRDRLEFRITAE